MLEACRALASIAYDSSSRAAAVDAGAVPLLLEALARYPKLTQVADAVIRALCTLAHEPAGAHAIVAAGGIPLIVNSVRAVPKTACCFVATNACGVLASVSKARGNCAAIVASGGVRMLRAVLCKHDVAWNAHGSACRALGNIASHLGWRAGFSSKDFVAAMVAAVAPSMGVEKTAGDACWAIGALAASRQLALPQ